MKSLFFAVLAIASFAADSFGQTIINSVPYNITAPGTYPHLLIGQQRCHHDPQQ